MQYYLLLSASVILFSLQFLLNQKFQEKFGDGLNSSAVFSLLSSAGGFLVLLLLNGFKLDFSWFSFLIGIAYSLVGILYTFASVRAFNKVNLSAYSVFAMLGGMLLPSIYGIAFNSEAVTLLKILCYTFTAIALFFTVDFRQRKSGTLYYALVFLLNGLSGVISVIHQSITRYPAVDSTSFLILARLSATAMCLPFFLKNYSAVKHMITKSAFVYTLGFAAFCGIGNLFVLIALKHLPASVQYPIITGGVMFFSLIISLIRKEKLGIRNIIATTAAFLSTLMLAM